MNYGRMNKFITIVTPTIVKDTDGFGTKTDVTVASVRAYREGRHGSRMWANRAAFSDATELFRFRVIPNTTITTAMVILCDGHRFEITSVEDVNGRGMYVEALCRETKPNG